MSDNPSKLTRQELYERVRKTGKEAYILDEMKRLGFWERDSEKPTMAEHAIRERNELQQKLRQLGKDQRLYQDPEQALKALHKERKKAAMEKREETRQARNEARFQRATRWHHTQKKLITFVGEGLSHGLKHVLSDEEKLKAQSLAVLHDSLALATAMGITLNELRFLVYQKEVSTLSHYQRFEFIKKSGGVRRISAPMPRLKRAQYWVLANILEPLVLHDAAHGFVPKRSIVSNAQPHVGKDIVINLDLKDFFPTVSYARVKGIFNNLGYSEHLATVLALLCTESDVQAVEMDLKTWYVANGERYLPQGAPTSPNLSNLICRKLDARLQGMADSLGFSYSRYADDVTFSANGTEDKTIQQLLWRCRGIIKDEGFVVHPDKTRIMRKHKKQEVTGIVVNDKLSVDRKTLKRFRALLFQLDKDGLEGKTWGKGNLISSIDGYANYVAMVNPEKGLPFQLAVAKIKLKYAQPVKPGKLSELNRKLMRSKAAAGEAPRSDWWQASAPPLPVKELTAAQIGLEKQKAKQQNKALDQAETQVILEEKTETKDTTDRLAKAMMTMSWVILVLMIIFYWW